MNGSTIAAVGRVTGSGRDEIDARGLLVTPGFVDIHTHYDAQVTWDRAMLPSSNHGVTTVVMGNCGVGFAPCTPSARDLLMTLMEGIEDIPLAAMSEGLPWTWESFPDYLNFLETRSCDVDFATQVPHSAVRVFAMGRPAPSASPPPKPTSPPWCGSCRGHRCRSTGFSMRTLLHRTLAGASPPEATAAEEELLAIAGGIGALGTGVLQFIGDFNMVSEDGSAEFAMWRRVAGRRAVRFPSRSFRTKRRPPFRQLLALVAAANDDGLTMRGRCRAGGGHLYSLELSGHPFVRCPSYVRSRTATPRRAR